MMCMPQIYRCMKGQSFANDWVCFLLDDSEQEWFNTKGIPYAEPVARQFKRETGMSPGDFRRQKSQNV